MQDIPTPQGYKRIGYSKNTYSNWIRNIYLKSNNNVKMYNGKNVPVNFYNTLAVIDMPLLFKQDLEQCADYCFRFWAEYHKQNNKLNKLYLFDYNGKKRLFRKIRKSFKNFLKWAMANANSYSLRKGCEDIEGIDIKPGDMIVQNIDGGIGHVSIIMDVCKSESNKRLYLIGFSYMPAQEFHIEKSINKFGKAGWFTIKGYYDFLKEYLDLGTPVLKRFKEL